MSLFIKLCKFLLVFIGFWWIKRNFFVIKYIISAFSLFVSKNFAYIFFILYYISLLCWGIGQVSIAGLNLGPWDFVTGFIIFFLLLKNKYYLTLKYKIVFQIFFVFILYSFIPFYKSIAVSPLKGFTLILQFLRCILIFSLSYYFAQKINIVRLNQLIFNIGFFYSILMLILYVYILKTGNQFLGWEIFEHGEFHSIRFQGFAGDPNFLGMLLALPFYIGIYEKRSILKILPILVMIILTLSRSVIVFTLFSYFLILLLELNISKIVRNFLLFGFLMPFIYGLISIKIPQMGNYSIIDIFFLRLTHTSSPRFEMWKTLLSHFWDSPIFGLGLRSTQLILGGHYSHNTYLDLLIEYGSIGLFIFLVIIFIILKINFDVLRKKSNMEAYVNTSILITLCFFFFTLLYYPYFWLVSGIILGKMARYESRYYYNYL